MTTEPDVEQLELFERELEEQEDKRVKKLWREVLDDGDTDALHQLAEGLGRVDDRELGAGD